MKNTNEKLLQWLTLLELGERPETFPLICGITFLFHEKALENTHACLCAVTRNIGGEPLGGTMGSWLKKAALSPGESEMASKLNMKTLQQTSRTGLSLIYPIPTTHSLNLFKYILTTGVTGNEFNLPKFQVQNTRSKFDYFLRQKKRIWSLHNTICTLLHTRGIHNTSHQEYSKHDLYVLVLD